MEVFMLRLKKPSIQIHYFIASVIWGCSNQFGVLFLPHYQGVWACSIYTRNIAEVAPFFGNGGCFNFNMKSIQLLWLCEINRTSHITFWMWTEQLPQFFDVHGAASNNIPNHIEHWNGFGALKNQWQSFKKLLPDTICPTCELFSVHFSSHSKLMTLSL